MDDNSEQEFPDIDLFARLDDIMDKFQQDLQSAGLTQSLHFYIYSISSSGINSEGDDSGVPDPSTYDLALEDRFYDAWERALPALKEDEAAVLELMVEDFLETAGRTRHSQGT